LVRELGRVLQCHQVRFWARSNATRIRGRLVGGFFEARGQRSELLWLGGKYESRAKAPDREQITEVLLPEVERAADHERKLARVWLVLRELMAIPPDDSRTGLRHEFLPLWNRALGVWSGTAAWLGLHGHIHLGGLAGLNSMAQVRAQLREVDPT